LDPSDLPTLELLDLGFASLSAGTTPLATLRRFVRYALAAVAGLFLAPLLFMKLGLAEGPPAAAGAAAAPPRR
jgi:hypothetical protein